MLLVKILGRLVLGVLPSHLDGSVNQDTAHCSCALVGCMGLILGPLCYAQPQRTDVNLHCCTVLWSLWLFLLYNIPAFLYAFPKNGDKGHFVLDPTK